MTSLTHLQHSCSIQAKSQEVLAALTTLQGMQSWHSKPVAGDGSVGSQWHIQYLGKPDFVWKIESSAANQIVWSCLQGPGDSIGKTVTFTITPVSENRTTLEVDHAGWSEADPHLAKCNTLWGDLLHHLKRFLESKQAKPAH
jgi:hypothetical protein